MPYHRRPAFSMPSSPLYYPAEGSKAKCYSTVVLEGFSLSLYPRRPVRSAKVVAFLAEWPSFTLCTAHHRIQAIEGRFLTVTTTNDNTEREK